MNNYEFREWLKGFFELSGEEAILDSQRIQIIINHLNLAESVEGHLDEINHHLRIDIQNLRKQPSPSAAEYRDITKIIRQRVLQA
jgi:hypothetical protein